MCNYKRNSWGNCKSNGRVKINSSARTIAVHDYGTARDHHICICIRYTATNPIAWLTPDIGDSPCPAVYKSQDRVGTAAGWCNTTVSIICEGGGYRNEL